MSLTIPSRSESSKSWWRLSSKSDKSLHRTSTDYQSSTRETTKNHAALSAFASVIGLRPKRIPAQDQPPAVPVVHPAKSSDRRKSHRDLATSFSLSRSSTLSSPSGELQTSHTGSQPSSKQAPSRSIPNEALQERGSCEPTFVGGPLCATQTIFSSSGPRHDRPSIRVDIPSNRVDMTRRPKSAGGSSRCDCEEQPVHPVRSATLKNSRSSESRRTNLHRSLPGSVDRVAGKLSKAWTSSSNSLSDLFEHSQRREGTPPTTPQDSRRAVHQGPQLSSDPCNRNRPRLLSSPKPSSISSHFLPDLAKSAKPQSRISRQSPLVRLVPAPSAPPTSKLPSPPVELTFDEVITSSQTSCSMSFASLAAMDYAPMELDILADQGKSLGSDIGRKDGLAIRDLAAPSLMQTSTKEPSRRSFSASPIVQTRSAPSSPIADDPLALGRLRKQRSFHHSFKPVPPLPTPRQSNVPVVQSQPAVPAVPPDLEQRRGSTSGLSVGSTHSKKRFFTLPGTSQRRTTTSHASQEEDTGSSISLRSENQSVRALFTSHITPSPEPSPEQISFWDEDPELLSSPTTAVPVEYTPQQIMSPAEMLKVEASVMLEASDDRPPPSRSRTLSFTSTATMVSETMPQRSSSAFSSPPSPRGVSEQSSAARYDWHWGDSLPSSAFREGPSSSSLKDGPKGCIRAPSSCSSQLLPLNDLSAGVSASSAHPPAEVAHAPGRGSPVHITPLSPPPRSRSRGRSSGIRGTIPRKQSFLDFEAEPETPPTDYSFLEFDSGPDPLGIRTRSMRKEGGR